MKGLIFSVKKYAIHDGPGIRITFFLKGCSLSCWWCHNPEGISPLPGEAEQIDRIGEKEFKRREIAGKYYSVEDILSILETDRIFLEESGGGVTFSGGEPLNQPEFLIEALKACKMRGFHTTVDTSGFSMPENYRKILPFTDLFLFDIKHLDNKAHIKYTGVPNELILENFRMIALSGKEIMVRFPVIPGLNDDAVNLEMIRDLILGNNDANIKKLCLLPYHRIGATKYDRFNLPYKMNGIEPPSVNRMNDLKEYFKNAGISTKVGG